MTYEATATDRVLAWWNAGDTGLSSETLALELLGAFYREKDASARLWFRKMSREDDHPHDPADLGRCLRLIADVPEVRACVDRLAERNEHWRRLAPVWRSVLVDEGFEFHEQDAYQWWAMQVGTLGLEVAVGEGPAGQLFLGDIDGRDLRSPADLRVRVGHARGLFGEGT